MMKRSGTYLVPTIYVGTFVEQAAKAGKLSPDSAQKALEIAPKMRSSFQMAYIIRAISPGQFHQPATSIEDMYRPELRGRTDTRQITIVE